MLRRTFFKFLGTAVVGASMAAHETLGELIPLPILPAKVEEWWYLAEMVEWSVRGGAVRSAISHVMVLREPQLAAYGLKPEDFPIKDEVKPEYGILYEWPSKWDSRTSSTASGEI